MQFKAVCFDLDGTLLDSLADLADCTNKILLKRGFPEHPVDAFRYFVGDGAKMLMTRVLPEEVRNESLIEDCRQDFETSYRECWNEQTIPYKDIPELLDALIGRQLKLTVLSNKPNEFTLLMVENLLAQWNFQQLEIPAEAFLYLGDTATDMKTAVSAGCFPVGVLWGFRTEEELRDNGARAIVKEPLDVLDFLI